MTAPTPDPDHRAPVLADDWPAQAADKIESVVGSVRDKTTGPVLSAARWTVYGLIVTVVGIAAAVLLVAGGVRLLDELLEGIDGERRTWAAYTILGVIFLVPGLILLVKARRRPSDDES